jgi:ATP-dependent Zn protease
VDVRKLLRGPIFWIALAVLFVLIGSTFISGIGAPEQVDTSKAISQIQSNNVDTATIVDRDQVLELTLKASTSRSSSRARPTPGSCRAATTSSSRPRACSSRCWCPCSPSR